MVQKLVGVRAAHAVQDLGFHVMFLKGGKNAENPPSLKLITQFPEVRLSQITTIFLCNAYTIESWK